MSTASVPFRRHRVRDGPIAPADTWLQELQFSCAANGLTPATSSQLPANAPEVRFDRVDRDIEFCGDLGRGEQRGSALEHLALPLGQPLDDHGSLLTCRRGLGRA